MSSVFYDHLIDLKKVEKHIKKVVKTPEEREELYKLVDEIVHHRVIGCILDNLPADDHEAFMRKLVKKPHDRGILKYLAKRVAEDVEEFIKFEINKLAVELLSIVEEKTRPSEKSELN